MRKKRLEIFRITRRHLKYMSWQTWKAIVESERAKSRGTSGGKIAVDKLNSRHEAENVENKNKNKTEKIYENKIY